jgi:hypothetical protein
MRARAHADLEASMKPFASASLAACLLGGTIIVAGAVAPAIAGPCGEEIARIEPLARGGDSAPNVGPTSRQSVGAQLHHQPTRQSVEQAEKRANTKVLDVLDRAKALDREGKEEDCMKTVQEAKDLLGL